MNEQNPNNLISLREATKYCEYSADYLKLRAGQGKLKAVKIGRDWLTSKEWIEDYLRSVAGHKNNSKTNQDKFNFNFLRTLRTTLVLSLAVPVLVVVSVTGTVLAKGSLVNIYQRLDARVREISQAEDRLVVDSIHSFNDISASVRNMNLADIASAFTYDLQGYIGWLKTDYLTLNNLIEEKLTDSINKTTQLVTKPFQLSLPNEIKVTAAKPKTTTATATATTTLPRQNQQVTVEKQIQQVIQPIKEVTRETVVTTIDDSSLKDIRSSISNLQTELAKRLYAPGGVISQQIYVTQPVSSPKIYQENGDIVLQTSGSGNVILSAATGVQIAGKQVVINSTSLDTPLIYLANPARINGDTQVEGILTAGPVVANQAVFNAPVSYTGNIIDIQSGGTSKFSIARSGAATLTGSFTMTGTMSQTGTLSLSTSSSSAILTVNQQGGGNIVDFQNSGVSAFNIDNLGEITVGTTSTSTLFSIATSTPIFNVTTGGKVGIGTTNPGANLEISNAAGNAQLWLNGNASNTQAVVYKQGGSSVGWIGFENGTDMRFRLGSTYTEMMRITSGGNVGIGTTTPVQTLTIQGTSSTPVLGAWASNSAPVLYLTSAGNVGIGTTSPQSVLNVNGEITGTISETDGMKLGFGTGYRYGISMPVAGQVKYTLHSGANGAGQGWYWSQWDGASTYTDRMYLSHDGYLGIGTTSPAQTLTVQGTSSAAILGAFASNSSPVLYLTSAGNVGINTTAPLYSLDVNGNFRAVATSTFSGNVGIGTTSPARLLEIVGSVPFLRITATQSGHNDAGIEFGTTTAAYWQMGLDTSQLNTTNFGIRTTQDSIDRLTIKTNGYIGIGTTTPASLLEMVSAATSSQLTITVASTSTSINPQIVFRTGTASSTTNRFLLGVNQSNSNNFTIATSTFGTNDLLTIDSNTGNVSIATTSTSTLFAIGTTTPIFDVTTAGNISIGTTSPQVPLHIFKLLGGIPSYQKIVQIGNQGIPDSSGDLFEIYGVNDAIASNRTFIRARNDLSILNNTASLTGIPSLYIKTSGNIGIATTSPAQTLTIQGTSSTPILGVWASNSAPVLYVNSAGYVGIGTASPLATLHVNKLGSDGILLTSDISVAWRGIGFDIDSAGVQRIHSDYGNNGTDSALVLGSLANRTNQLYLDTTGNIGIGTTTPGYRLTVALAPGTATSTYALAVQGSVEYTGTLTALHTGLDVAERYPIDPVCQFNNDCPETGDLVSISDNLIVRKSDSPYDSKLLGVVAGNPAIQMAGNLDVSNSRAIALVGRVPVKVSLENGPIAIGDPLTPSSIPGVAMKATKAGRVAGIALQAYDGSNSNNTVLVFVNPHWQGNDLAIQQNDSGQLVNLSPEQLKSGLASLGLIVTENGSLQVQELRAKTMESQEIHTEKIQTEEIEVRDKITGELYCTWIDNGEWKKVPGECVSASAAREATTTIQ